MAETAGRIDFKQNSNLQKENEKSVGSSSNEHSATAYGQIGFHSRPTDDSFDNGGGTIVPSGWYYNASSFAAMNAARVKVPESFNLSDDHCTLEEGSPKWPFMRQRVQAVKGERGKANSVVSLSKKPLNAQLTSSIGKLQSTSQSYCTTKSLRQGDNSFLTTEEIFKSASDSRNGSEGLEQLMVMCIYSVYVCYCCQSFSCCRVAYPTVMVVIVTMKTGFHYWDPAVKVFIFLVIVNYQ